MRKENQGYVRKRRIGEIGCCIPGAIMLFALMFAFCWLCCACSGYHWE